MSPQFVTSNADYSRLDSFLKEDQWREADEETGLLMLKIARAFRKYDGLTKADANWLKKISYLTNDDAIEFPCYDLLIIDELWQQYSSGHFGLTAQAEIWDAVGQDYMQFALALA